MFSLPFNAKKIERVSFKSGCVVRVVKHIKGDWFIVFVLLLKSFIANVLKCNACLKQNSN